MSYFIPTGQLSLAILIMCVSCWWVNGIQKISLFQVLLITCLHTQLDIEMKPKSVHHTESGTYGFTHPDLTSASLFIHWRNHACLMCQAVLLDDI